VRAAARTGEQRKAHAGAEGSAREQKVARAGEERTGGGQRAGVEGSARGRRAHGKRTTRGRSAREEGSARGNFSFLRAPRALALDSRRLLPPFFLPNASGASESSTGRRFNAPGDAILSTVMASTTLEDSARPDA
jgi:hypothetical protein